MLILYSPYFLIFIASFFLRRVSFCFLAGQTRVSSSQVGIFFGVFVSESSSSSYYFSFSCSHASLISWRVSSYEASIILCLFLAGRNRIFPSQVEIVVVFVCVLLCVLRLCSHYFYVFVVSFFLRQVSYFVLPRRSESSLFFAGRDRLRFLCFCFFVFFFFVFLFLLFTCFFGFTASFFLGSIYHSLSLLRRPQSNLFLAGRNRLCVVVCLWVVF